MNKSIVAMFLAGVMPAVSADVNSAYPLFDKSAQKSPPGDKSAIKSGSEINTQSFRVDEVPSKLGSVLTELDSEPSGLGHAVTYSKTSDRNSNFFTVFSASGLVGKVVTPATELVGVLSPGGENSAPVITSGSGDTGTFTIDENTTEIGTIAATDSDSGDTLTFSVSGGADSDEISIDSSSGVLSFDSAPDFEIPTGGSGGNSNAYEVVVQVTDGTGTDSQTVTVNVSDVDPTITVTGNGQNIADEDDTPTTTDGTDFGTLEVGDSLTRTFTVSSSGDDLTDFNINNNRGGHLVTNTSPTLVPAGGSVDFTVTFSPPYVISSLPTNVYFVPNAGGANLFDFDLAMAAEDTTAPTLTVNTGSTVAEGGTDEIPNTELQFTDLTDGAVETYSITSATANGTLFVDANANNTYDAGEELGSSSTFTQTDIDNGNLQYVHNGGETSSDAFTFTVNDPSSNATGSQTFAINVTAVNDAPTDIALDSTSIGASAATNGATVGGLTATDADDSTFTFTLVDDGASANGDCGTTLAASNNDDFSISGTNLVVGSSSLNTGSYSICVQANDDEGAQFQEAFVISVEDTTAPTVTSITRSSPSDEDTNSSSATFSVAFSEEVQNVDTADFTIAGPGAGGTASIDSVNNTSGNQTFSVAVTNINTDGSLALGFSSQDITDTASNALTDTAPSGDHQGYDIDQTAPSGYSASFDSAVNSANASAATFTITGGVVGETYSYTITDGDNAPVSDSGTFTATSASVSPDVQGLNDGTLTLSVTSTDQVGNQGTAATSTEDKDTVIPSVTLTSDASGTQSSQFNVTFTVSEAGTDFAYADVSVTNATDGGSFSSSSDPSFTLAVTPSGNDGVTVTVGSGTFEDTVGNSNTSEGTFSIASDVVAPTVTSIARSTPSAERTNADAVTFAVTFSEDVQSVSDDDFVVTGFSSSQPFLFIDQVSSSVHNVIIAADGFNNGELTDYDGSLGLELATSPTIQDTAGNSLTNTTSGSSQTYTIDNTAPAGYSATIDAVVNSLNDTAAAFTFADAEVGSTFTYTITDGSNPVSGSGTIGLAAQPVTDIDVQGLNDGVLTLSVALTDPQGNQGTFATDTETKDTVLPTVDSLDPVDGDSNVLRDANFVVAFSESIALGTGSIEIFDTDDASTAVATIDVTNHSSQLTVSGSTLTINPSSDLEDGEAYYVNIDATAIDDLNGNSYAGISNNSDYNFTVPDVTGPTITDVSIAATSMKVGDVVTATITVDSDSDDYTQGSGGLSGDINGFSVGTLNRVSATQYTTTFTVNEGGNDVAADSDIPVNIVLTDSTGNTGQTYSTGISQAGDELDANTPSAPASLDLVAASDLGNSSSDNDTADTTPDITGTAEAGTSVTLTSSASGVVGSANTGSDGTWTITASTLTEGAHTLTATATDTVGNTSAVSSGLTLTVDATAPTFDSSTPVDDAQGVAVGSTLTLSFSEDMGFVDSQGITVFDVSNNQTFESFTASTATSATGSGSGHAVISGGTMAVTPSQSFAAGTEYAVQIPAASMTDSSGVAFAGILDTTTVSFTTAPNVVLSSSATAISEVLQDSAVFTVQLQRGDGSAFTAVEDVAIQFSFDTDADETEYTLTGLNGLNDNELTITQAAGSDSAEFTLTAVRDDSVSTTDNTFVAEVATITVGTATEATAQSATVTIAENVLPTVSNLPTALTVDEDVETTLGLAAAEVADTEGQDVTVTFAVSSGTLNSPAGSSGGVTVSGDSSASLVLAGTPANINTFLDQANAMAFTTVQDGNDDVTLTVTPNDGIMAGNAVTSTLSVTPSNDNPTASVKEEITFDVTGATGSGTDTIVEVESGITLTINGSGGRFNIATFNGLSFEGDGIFEQDGVPEASFTLSEALALESLVFVENFNVTGVDYSFSVTSGTGTPVVVSKSDYFSGTNVVTFSDWEDVTSFALTSSSDSNFSPALDNIIVSRPGEATGLSFTFNEDELSNVDLSDIEFADVDSAEVTVTLSVTDGSFSEPADGTTIGGGVVATLVSATEVTLLGAPGDLNTYLNTASNIQYTGSENTNGDGAATLSITADDGDGSGVLSLATITINLTSVNDNPTIDTSAVTSVDEDSAYSYTVTASDVDDGATVTLTAPTLPSWLTFVPSTGELTGTPTNSEVGDHAVVITATDELSGSSSQSFTVTVNNTNDAPTIDSTEVTTATEDAGYTYTVVASDVDVGDTLTLAATTLPSWLTFVPSTGVLSGTPTNDFVGSNDVVIAVTDTSNATDTQSFSIVVANTNDQPGISSTPVTTATEDAAYSYTFVANDVDGGDSLTYAAPTLPSWLTFVPSTGVLSGTPTNDDVGSHTVVLTATDTSDAVDSQTFTVTVANTNDAPVITSSAVTSATEDTDYSYTFTASDVDAGDTLTLSASSIPGWLNFNAGTGVLSGTPANADVGSHSVTLVATDGSGATDTQSFSIVVANTNDAPVITSTPVTAVDEDSPYSYSVSVTDVDVGDNVSIIGTTVPSWLSLNGSTLSGTPINDDVGSHPVVLAADDGNGGTDVQSFSIVVANVNDAPVISGTPATSVTQDAAYSFTPTVEDVDSTNLSFSVENLPSWAEFDTATGSLTGTPTNDDVGTYTNIVISVSDGALSDSLPAFSIEVGNVNDAPVISGEPLTTVNEDDAYNFTPIASDPDQDELVFSIQNQPGWLAFDTTDGSLSGTPGDADVGVYENIVISVSDGENTVSLPAFSLEVVNINDVPTLTGVPQSIDITEDVTAALALADVAITDDDNDVLTFTLSVASGVIDILGGDGDSAGLNISGSGTNTVVLIGEPAALNDLLATTGDGFAAITYTTALNDDTDDTLTLTLTDNNSDALAATVALPIGSVNDAPVIEGEPGADVKVGQDYAFTPTASDVEGDDLTFSITNLPRWATFDEATGSISGTPGSSDVGTYGGIIISVSDGTDSSDLAEFSIEVIANAAPVISGAPLTQVPIGEAYNFTPTATDDDGDALTFSIENAPSWAAFSAEDGSLAGTPGTADVGTTSGIVISVTDGIDTTSLTAFDIIVCDVCDDVPPTISGIPATEVVEGATYEFVPVASDANGDTLTFSIENQPAWASFDTATGALTGTPGEVNVGISTGIVISVSDGNSTVSLDAFSIEVLPANDAPSISGVPGISVFQGDEYRFTPTASDPDGDTLRFGITNLPGWASFNPATGTLRGTPGGDDVGSYNNIIISVTDTVNEPVSLAAFGIEVVARNTAPEIGGEPRTAVTQGNAYSFTPTAVDADGDTLTFSIENSPAWAAFDAATGTLSGTPGEGDVGSTGGIVISVTDGTDSASLAAFGIEVTSSNSAPVASDSSETVAEDSSVSFFVQATDADDDELSFSIVNGTGNGQLSAIPGGFLYAPAADFVGSDSFVFTANDGTADSNTATVSIAVTSVNDAPVAVDDSFSVDQVEGGVYILDVLANDTDVDIATAGDSLTLEGVDANLGQATIVGNQIQYSPGNSFIGTVSLSYSVRDGAGARDQATVDLTINGVAGVGAPTLTVPSDITVDATGLFTRVDLGVASAVDADGNPLPVSLVESSNVFAPGSHTVFWQAEDRFGTTSTGSQDVNVNPLVSIGDSRIVSEGTQVAVPVILNGDAPAYPLTISYSVSGSATGGGVDHDAADGSVTFASGREELITFDVLLDSEVEADETIVFTLDGTANVGASNVSTITISEENIAPEIQLSVVQSGESRLTVAQDEGSVTITGTVTDLNPQDTVQTDWVPPADVANSSTDASSFIFDPAGLAQGVYEFSLFASDDGDPVKSNIESVFIDVVDTLAVLDDTTDSDGDLIPDSQEGYTDSDGDGIPDYLDAIDDCNVVPEQADTQDGFLVESDPGVCMRQGSTSALNPSNGLEVIFDEIGQRRVGTNEKGEDVVFVASDLPEDRDAANIGGVFDFVLYDLPEEGQSVQVVLPQVQPVPQNAVYRKYKAAQQQWVDFVTDDLNEVFSTAGEPGVCPPPGDSSWTPGLTEGDWCVQLLIQDGGPNDDDGLPNGAIVDPGGVAVVLDNNALPTPLDDTLLMQWNTSEDIDVLANDSDPDGDNLVIVNVSASFGEVVINNGDSLTYTPDAGFVGEDTLIYAVSDGNNGTGSAQVQVTINGNRAPGAVDDLATTNDQTPIEIDVLANDIDVDGDSLTVTMASALTGVVSITAGNTLLYVPVDGFAGTDTITYAVQDSFGSSAVAMVTVTVELANTAPVAVDDSVVTAFNTPVTIDVLANDTDDEGNVLTVVEAVASSGGVSINADNTLTFTPDTGFSGQVTIDYTISDGLLTSSASVAVTVQPEPIETVTVTNRSSGGGSMGLGLGLLAILGAGFRRLLGKRKNRLD